MNIYEDINNSVSAHDIARWLGLDVKKNLMLCPFHPDRNPSMHVYKDSFYCFSCGKHEDSIGMVAAMRNIPMWEAVKEINTAFSLGFSVGEHKETEDEKLNRVIYKKSRELDAKDTDWRDRAIETVGELCRYYGAEGYPVAHLEELHDRLIQSTPRGAYWYRDKVIECHKTLKAIPKSELEKERVPTHEEWPCEVVEVEKPLSGEYIMAHPECWEMPEVRYEKHNR